ncbi:MAG: ribosome biogenesis GTPase Der [Gemmatimonadota bacterium]|nr:ribosome biogenesis GTPase Der [Gemmatimonadota bacterium]MDH4352144.1 ribosome biogenesis GTPase Der [Gemmatimonadota bacterium]MDH5197006.1 ribosome biogenesis GTPase Der [Gemmatimonadota bacterium]
MSRHTIAIVGRPNVGKSTLFNRLAGGRRAITHDRPGVTRDRQFAPATWNGRDFWLVDTGGWTATGDDALSTAVRRQVTLAIADADVVLLVVDARAGVHPADLGIAGLLRQHRERVLVAANKVDDPLEEPYAHLVFHELGLGEPCPVSAAAGKGTGDLLDHAVALLPPVDSEAKDEDVIQVAVVGRPNVGKSSIVNRLLGEERAVVAPESGTTRDAIDSPLRYQDTSLNFIDTAGLRRRTKVKDEVEFYSALRTERAVERADVCVLVVDAADGLHVQDVRVASQVWEQGSGLIVAVNKWDLIEEKDTNTAERGRAEVVERAPFLDAVPFIYVSALTGQRVRRILESILEVAEQRHRRIGTAEVNRVLEALVQRNQPPQHGGQEVNILYGSQIGTAPPTFAIVSNAPDAVLESYQRFLANGFRSAWGFTGVPLRLKLRRKRGRR